MKVFFQASYTARGEYGKYYKLIYDELTKLGYTHCSDEIINVSTDDFYDKVQKGGRDAQIKFYNSNIKFLQEADINVFEATVHSLGIGFLIQKSLENHKPTVVLHLENKPVYFFLGMEDEKLILKSYNEKNYKQVLKEALEVARERRDKRFNFFLSPKLLEYLEDASTKQGVTKSKLIRDMIVERMRKTEGESETE